jgi:hypothetical protein
LTELKITVANRKASAGGLVGENAGLLFGDEISGTVISKQDAGGLAVRNYGKIVSCSGHVAVKSRAGLGGGLVAQNVGAITLSHADHSVRGVATGFYGGLVGANEGVISESYASGNASQGGLAGSNDSGANYVGNIENSYSTGKIDSVGSGGGLVGGENGTTTITSSYSTGAVQSGDGGFACQGPVNVSNDYWDTTTSGTDYGLCGDVNASGITGLTTKQLQSGLPAGFDPKIWAEDPKINNGFPYLINNPPEK